MAQTFASNAVYAAEQNTSDKASRIQSDTQTLLGMVQRAKACEMRIIKHAMALGYYQPAPSDAGQKPTPVSTSMSDAISDMDRALDSLSGSLNLFD